MKRSKFSLSHYKLLTCDMGELVPCACYEVLPGDTIQQASSALVRLSPMLAPVMHPVHMRIHHWYVPTRLIWDDFEDFITGGDDGEDASVYPTITVHGVGGTPNAAVGSLADYLGVPGNIAVANAQPVSALPFRAYAAIWNEWYRDQDLETELVIDTSSGADTTTNMLLQNCAWEKDYYTSARPWPQKGPDVTLPLGVSAPVVTTGVVPKFSAADAAFSNADLQALTSGAASFEGGASGNTRDVVFASPTGLQTDLSGATAASINDLRLAFSLQRFAEARARYGSRYTEYLRYLGVRSSDSRLQRPEYLGGGKQTVQMSEVLQTGVTTSGNSLGVGTLRGHGIGAMRSNRYRRFIEEHGYIISLLSVKPRTMYVQGLARPWNRRTKEDFYQKELEHIGQQEVVRKELYADQAVGSGAGQTDAVWGYQDRYDEYRRLESGVAGEFRSTTLDFWHMARIFTGAFSLNANFVKSNPTKRIFAVQSTDCLWIMTNHSIQARRLLSKTGSSFIY